MPTSSHSPLFLHTFPPTAPALPYPVSVGRVCDIRVSVSGIQFLSLGVNCLICISLFLFAPLSFD